METTARGDGCSNTEIEAKNIYIWHIQIVPRLILQNLDSRNVFLQIASKPHLEVD